jgi:hypothetical protein
VAELLGGLASLAEAIAMAEHNVEPDGWAGPRMIGAMGLSWNLAVEDKLEKEAAAVGVVSLCRCLLSQHLLTHIVAHTASGSTRNIER